LLLDATLQQDYPLVQGIVALSAMTYAALNMLADIIHQLLDPRVRS
jgi:peptide/nickel transport system permease protein